MVRLCLCLLSSVVGCSLFVVVLLVVVCCLLLDGFLMFLACLVCCFLFGLGLGWFCLVSLGLGLRWLGSWFHGMKPTY